jgi:hypothetical protein
MSTIIAGIVGPVWGVGTETAIVLSTINQDNTSEPTLFRNAAGESVAVAIHSEDGTLELEFAVETPDDAPARALIGSLFHPVDATNFADVYVVTGVSRSRRQGEWMSGRLTCKAVDNDTVTFSTSTTTT